MRELLVKNRISKDKKRGELFLSEHYEKEDVIQEIEKKTVYKVKEILEFTSISDLELFLNQKNKDGVPTQRFIIRNRDAKTGTLKVTYKITGEQCVVLNEKVVIVKVSQYVKKTIISKKKNQEFPAGKLS